MANDARVEKLVIWATNAISPAKRKRLTTTPTNTVPPPPTATTAPPAKACGDVNDDGNVNSIDAQLVLQLKAGLISSLVNEPSGDVNNSGDITSVDAALILQKDAGLIPQSSLVCPA